MGNFRYPNANPQVETPHVHLAPADSVHLAGTLAEFEAGQRRAIAEDPDRFTDEYRAWLARHDSASARR